MNEVVPSAGAARDRLTRLVVDAVTSPHSKRAYAKASPSFFDWVELQGQGIGSFSKALVTAYKSWLEQKAPGAGHHQPAPGRRQEARRRRLGQRTLPGEIAAAIGRVKGRQAARRRAGTG
jgi:hypothetical protein